MLLGKVTDECHHRLDVIIRQAPRITSPSSRLALPLSDTMLFVMVYQCLQLVKTDADHNIIIKQPIKSSLKMTIAVISPNYLYFIQMFR